MTPQPAPPVQPQDLHDRDRSVQVVLAFLLGIFITLLAVNLMQGRQTRPLEVQSFSGYRLDLNRASATEFAQLPRIGWATANLIADAGPFETVDDLRRVPGIGSATLDKVKPFVTVGDTARYYKRVEANHVIDPNNASLEELQTIPGIGPKIAQRIIDEREKQPFASVEDMRRVAGIGPKTLEKLRGRVKINGRP